MRLEWRRDADLALRRLFRKLPEKRHGLPIEQLEKPVDISPAFLVVLRALRFPRVPQPPGKPIHLRPVIRRFLRNQNIAAVRHDGSETLNHPVRSSEHIVSGLRIHLRKPSRYPDPARHAVQLSRREMPLRQHQVRPDHPGELLRHARLALQFHQPIRFPLVQKLRQPRNYLPRRRPPVEQVARLLELRQRMPHRHDLLRLGSRQLQRLWRPLPRPAAKQSALRQSLL